MRKRIIDQCSWAEETADQKWLDVARLAQVELTSEDPGFPIESALLPDSGAGWRAQQPGPQLIRVVFDEPQRVGHVRLAFEEEHCERTQEFVVRWSADGGKTYREVVRQLYHFSPPGTTRELEDYAVGLEGVTVVELSIVPDIGRGGAIASLAKMLLG